MWIFVAVLLMGVAGVGLLVRQVAAHRMRFAEVMADLSNTCRSRGWQCHHDSASGEFSIQSGEWTCRYGQHSDDSDVPSALEFSGLASGPDFIVVSRSQHQFVSRVAEHGHHETHKKLAERLSPGSHAIKVLYRSFELRKSGRSQPAFRFGKTEYYGISDSGGVLSHLSSPSCQAMVNELIEESRTPVGSMSLDANRIGGDFRCRLIAVPASAQFVVGFIKLAEQLSRA